MGREREKHETSLILLVGAKKVRIGNKQLILNFNIN